MGGARGEGKGTVAPVPSSLSSPALPPGKILMVISAFWTLYHAKVRIIKRHFSKKTQIFVSFLAFPNIKKQANLRLPLHVQKLKVF